MRDERGFTLLEVLVAFIIAALALGALTQGVAGGLQSARVAAHYQEALSRARSRLATLDASLQPGEQRGDDGGGFAWRVLVQPTATAGAPRPSDPLRAGRAVLYAVRVEVAWRMDGGRSEVALMTQRLGTAPPDLP